VASAVAEDPRVAGVVHPTLLANDFFFFFSLGLGGGRSPPRPMVVVRPSLSFLKIFFNFLIIFNFLNIN
jgi:hypothetical protein